jgi:hypothetical protein
MLKLGILVATPFLLVALVFGATGVAVVNVQESGPGGTHLVIPVPLVLAQVALTFAPHEAKYVECSDFAPYAPLAEKIVAELRKAPDFTLIEVQEDDQHVMIKKVGKFLEVNVEERGETVHCRVPLKAAERFLASYDGQGFPTKAAIWALRGTPHGELVHVRDGGDEVSVRIL